MTWFDVIMLEVQNWQNEVDRAKELDSARYDAAMASLFATAHRAWLHDLLTDEEYRKIKDATQA